MTRITSKYRVDADPARFWEQLFDYDAPPPPFMKSARTEILEPGSPDPKGLGCVRRLHGGGKPTTERIVAWDPPRSFSYSVIDGPMPVTSYEGAMRMEPSGDGTIITYEATFTPKRVGTGWMIKALFKVMELVLIRRVFRWMGEEARKR